MKGPGSYSEMKLVLGPGQTCRLILHPCRNQTSETRCHPSIFFFCPYRLRFDQDQRRTQSCPFPAYSYLKEVELAQHLDINGKSKLMTVCSTSHPQSLVVRWSLTDGA